MDVTYQIIIEGLILIVLIFIGGVLYKILKFLQDPSTDSGGGSNDHSTGGGGGPRGVLQKILEVTQSIKQDTSTIAGGSGKKNDDDK